MDTTMGHGDVLVGFAAHVEQVGMSSSIVFIGTRVPYQKMKNIVL